ncbi:MAG: hypothetical protein KAR40_08395 [Candidatus Sabulitectum sp.]|nr:hypothetical protein [Candidatus Sabulitectum sp.]
MSIFEYQHLEIPRNTPVGSKNYLEKSGMYVVGLGTNSYGIELIGFTADSLIPELVPKVPHIAFETDNLLTKIKGKDILIGSNGPSEGVTTALIVCNGAPVEFLQYDKREDEQ